MERGKLRALASTRFPVYTSGVNSVRRKRKILPLGAFLFLFQLGAAAAQQEGSREEAGASGVSITVPTTISDIASPLFPQTNLAQPPIANLNLGQEIPAQNPLARSPSPAALPQPALGLTQNAAATAPAAIRSPSAAAAPLTEAPSIGAVAPPAAEKGTPQAKNGRTTDAQVEVHKAFGGVGNAKSLREIESGHDVSTNLNALFDENSVLLKRSASGDWDAAHPSRAASGLLRAANFLKKRGVDVPFQSIRVSQNPAAEQTSGEPSLVLLSRDLKAALGLDKRSDPVGIDGLVRLLLRKHLEAGIAEPLRFSPNETAKLGLGADSSVTAEEALAAFEARWLKKFPELERALRRRSGEDAAPVARINTLDSAAKSVFIAPGLDMLFFQRSFGGGIMARGVGPKGDFAEREQNLDFGGRTLKGVYFDPAEKSLILVGNTGREYTLEKRPLSPDGKIGEAAERISLLGPADALGAFYDAATRSLILVGDQTAEIFEISGKSAIPTSKIEAPGSWSGAAYDAARGLLYLADAVGEKISTWNVSKDGRLSPGVESRTSRPIETLIFNAADKTILGYDLDSRRYEIFSTSPDGRVQDEEKSITFPVAASGKNIVALNPANGAIYALGALYGGFFSGAPALFQFSPDSAIQKNRRDPIADHSGLSPPVVDALSAKIGNLPEKRLQKLAETAKAGNRRWAQSLWNALGKHVSSGGPGAKGQDAAKAWWSRIFKSPSPNELTQIPGSQFWLDAQSRDVIRQRMPTLWALLSDPQRLPKFLMALSFLRLSHHYDLNHAGKFAAGDTPLSWARQHQAVFQLNELRIAPVSSSFRRHIIYVEDSEGFFAVELKMPGQDPGRGYIEPENFTVAKDLWDKSPHDPGVVKPLYFGQFAGSARLYGKNVDYGDKSPLGLLLFSYDDGERFKHAAPLMQGVAAEKKTSFNEILLQVAADATVAAVRLHRMGWSGSSGNWTDMHDENIRVTKEGRGVLVADFGVFSREPMTMKDRRRETLRQLGQYAVPNVLNAIYPEVVRRLSEGVADELEREKIADDVRQELGI